MPVLDAPPPAPAPVRAAAATLARRGHATWLAGEALADHWRGASAEPTAAPSLVTDAPLETVLAAFPRAVPTGPQTLALPSAIGPIDFVTQQSLPALLDRFGFTLHAIAWDLATGRVHDPHGGLDDLRQGRLRTIAAPQPTFTRWPLLALRALRLVAEFDLALEQPLVQSLGAAPLSPTARLRVAGRPEIIRMLCGPQAGAALALAAESGLAAKLAPRADAGLARWIDRLPTRPDLRLAVWLGADAGPWLRAWGFRGAFTDPVLRLAHHHPIEQAANPRRDASVGRLLARISSEDRQRLQHAREAQLESNTLPPGAAQQAREGLAALADAIVRVEGNHRFTRARGALALTGAQVIEQLGCEPGPEVGRALRYLAALVEEQPDRNTPPELRAALARWVDERAASGSPNAAPDRSRYGPGSARPKRSRERGSPTEQDP